jgi:hypothetical protein
MVSLVAFAGGGAGAMLSGITLKGALAFATFLAFGAFLVMLGMSTVLERRRFVLAAARARGRIVALQEGTHTRGMGKRFVHPVIEFRDGSGRTQRFTGDQGFYNRSAYVPRGLRWGTEVDVLYDPARPHDAHIAGRMLYFGGAVGIALGFAFLALSVVALEIR